MSYALSHAVRKGTLPSHERLLLSCLADYADEKGHCWPSRTSLALDAAISIRQFKRTMGSLIRKGYVKSDRKGHHHNTAHYYIDTEKVYQDASTRGGTSTTIRGDMGVHQGGHGCPPNRHQISESIKTITKPKSERHPVKFDCKVTPDELSNLACLKRHYRKLRDQGCMPAGREGLVCVVAAAEYARRRADKGSLRNDVVSYYVSLITQPKSMAFLTEELRAYAENWIKDMEGFGRRSFPPVVRRPPDNTSSIGSLLKNCF